jgi:CheY-like chemotaxis protein
LKNAQKNILVVEDDRDIQAAITLVLETQGYRVAAAANGRDALDYLHRSEPPDLVLLDLMMPVMDGWQFRREQKRDPALAAIPVIVISSASNAPSLGVKDVLEKPVAFDRLLNTVRRYC